MKKNNRVHSLPVCKLQALSPSVIIQGPWNAFECSFEVDNPPSLVSRNTNNLLKRGRPQSMRSASGSENTGLLFEYKSRCFRCVTERIYYARSMIIGSLERDGFPATVGVIMPRFFQFISLSESENLNDSIKSDNTTSMKLEIFSKIDDCNKFWSYSFPVVRTWIH